MVAEEQLIATRLPQSLTGDTQGHSPWAAFLAPPSVAADRKVEMAEDEVSGVVEYPSR